MAALSPSQLPFLIGKSGSPSNTWFLELIRVQNPNGISIGSVGFAQLTADCPYTLQWAAPSPLKLPLTMGICPCLTCDSVCLPKNNPKGISIGSSVFAGLTTVTDRQTDRQRDRSTDHVTRSVTIGGIYIRSTVIRPKNGWTDRDAAWYLDSGEPKEPSIKCGSRSPQANGQFLDERICPGMPDDTFPWPVQKNAVWVVDSDVIYYVGCTLAPPVEYD